MDAKEVVTYIQLVINSGALFGGAAIWKLYTDRLKETISVKDSQVSLWKDKVADLEKRSPEAMERQLAERIKIREEEISRLDADREEDRKKLTELKQQKEGLDRALEQAQGFQKMLEMEGDAEDLDELFEGSDIDVILLGSVGVDSGQLLITDPCYIDSEWRQESLPDVPRFRDMRTGKVFQYQVDFDHFQEKLSGSDKTVNELIADGILVRLPEDYYANRNFSYAGACAATLSEGYGELRYKRGHPGAGVTFGTAFGDGMYPVYGETRGGKIVRVYVNVA